MLQFGIDLGGTKTELIVLDDHGQIKLRKRCPTPSHSYTEILQTIADLVESAEHELQAKATALGVGAPGTPFGPAGHLKNANTTCLIGKPLAHDLANQINIPVIVENDANCLVLSEATDGAGAGASIVFGVILGTGVGGGLAINGKLVNGPNRITGEWGHNSLPRWHQRPNHQPRDCYCGLQDCIETYLSGKGLALTYEAITTQTQADAHTISKAAIQGDSQAQAALSEYFDALSASLATVINVLDPEVIVLAGGLSQLPGICDAVQGRLARHVFGGDGSTPVQTRIVTATHGDSSGVRGAAWLTRHINQAQSGV